MKSFKLKINNYLPAVFDMQCLDLSLIPRVVILKVKKIILGLPLRTDGKVGDTEMKVREFHSLLSEKIEIPTEFVCEAFTTVIAAQKLHEKGKNAKQQRQIIDSAAAAVMLQGYLDSHN